jgi:flagellin
MFPTDNSFAGSILSNILLNSQKMSQTIERLSTGKRINSAADDAAGLATSQMLESQINGYDQAIYNVQDATSTLQTADSALGQISGVLQKMETLAVQAGNSSNSSSDLYAIQEQMNQLAGQITSITNNTSFNGANLLSGSYQNRQYQLGPSAGNSMGFSINPMDAASLGIASSSATITPGQNGANIQSLAGVGNGLLSATTGEQYSITATQLNGGVNGATFNAQTNAAGTASAATNKGGENMNISLTGAYTGPGTALSPDKYQVQVTSVNSAGQITGIQYSTTVGSAPVWTQATSTTGNFSLSNGLTVSFANGAATAQAGDHFSFMAVNGQNQATLQSTVRNTTNVSDETVALSGNYTGSASMQYAIKAVQTDANNITGIQVSTDGGKTFGSTISATGYVVGSPTGPTNFDIGNGLTATITPGSINPTQVAANSDTFFFNAVAAGQSAQVLQLSDSTQLSGGLAKYSGTQANIGTGVLVAQGQTAATLGTGTQTVSASFNKLGTTGAIQSGTTEFTVATAQAATTANGVVLNNATAPAGPDIMTPQAAANALTAIQNAIDTVSLQQGQIGGAENRLSDTMSMLIGTSESLTQADSNISNTNFATEYTNLMTQRILQQSGMYALMQSNEIAKLYTKLLE